MKAFELIEAINKGATVPEKTCDTVKCGDPEKTVKKVGVTMFATVDVVKRAKEFGADMLIVHEPTYYDHMDVLVDDPVINAKKKLIEDSGILIYRYHDNMHYRYGDDLITKGQAKYMGLRGKIEPTQYFGSSMMVSETPISAKEIVLKAKKELGIPHVRAAGEVDKKFTKIALCFGTPGGVRELLMNEAEIVITGEASEWKISEYARDASLLGMDKAIIVMGHIGSEAGGMIVFADELAKTYPELEVKYFESGAVYKEI